jgi:hypothetical protein
MDTRKIGSFQHKRSGIVHLGIIDEGYRKVATMKRSDTHEDGRLAHEISRRHNAFPALVEALDSIESLSVDDNGDRIVPAGFLDEARALLATLNP